MFGCKFWVQELHRDGADPELGGEITGVKGPHHGMIGTVKMLNNFIHHKSGSNEYKDKQTNTTKLTLSSTYINRNIMVNRVSECVYKLSYQPNCTRLKISFLICLMLYVGVKEKSHQKGLDKEAHINELAGE